MEIKLEEKTIREVTRGYLDSAEGGVVGYDGKLDIRPPFQREFVYDDKKRDAVIDTVRRGFPLNVMYWVVGDDGKYELLDGQQRTISICQYVDGSFSVDGCFFHSLTKEEQDRFLDYRLMIYVCRGSDREKLDWFRIINIASVQLTAQELRNAVYTGPWLSDAKRYFSRRNSPAYGLGGNYLTGEANRQAYLETALFWICEREGKEIEAYMSEHQHDADATALWLYFQSVVTWVQTIFPVVRKEMKGLPWGVFFNHHATDALNPTLLEERIKELMRDDDVTCRRGIYEYLLDGKEKHLNIRAFTENQKRRAYERQRGVCPHCVRDHFEKTTHPIEEMEADHITPWSQGGRTSDENCQMLCKFHNRVKSDR